MRGTNLVVEVLFHIVKYCEKLTYNVRLVEGDYTKFIDRENRMVLDVILRELDPTAESDIRAELESETTIYK